VPGETSGEMIKRLPKLLAVSSFNIIAILGGTNDIAFKDESEILTNLKKLHTIAKDAGSQTVVITLPAFLKGPKGIIQNLAGVNNRLKYE
jgi:hypothetical protein